MRSRESAFRDLYDACYPDLLRFVQRRVHATHAEDVVADVFLVAWRRLDELSPEDRGAVRAWLFGVARGTLLNSRRGQERHRALGVRIAEVALVAERLQGEDEVVVRRLQLAAAWPRLSATHQEAIALVAWDGLSAPEAATVLGISPVAFRLRLSRARRALRRHLDEPDRRPARPAPAADRPAEGTAR